MYTAEIISVLAKYLSFAKDLIFFSVRREPSQQDVITQCHSLLAELHRYPMVNP
jgi:hypothetical protein